MALLKKADVSLGEAILPSPEEHEVKSLGGSVMVHPMSLDGRIAADYFSHGKRVSVVLAASVKDADGAQLMTADQWELHGRKSAEHLEEVMSLYLVAHRLAGMDKEDTAKKSDSPSVASP